MYIPFLGILIFAFVLAMGSNPNDVCHIEKVIGRIIMLVIVFITSVLALPGFLKTLVIIHDMFI